MKTLPILLLAAVLITSCTHTHTTTTRTTRTAAATAEDQTRMTPEERRIGNRRSYSHDDLQKTGQPTVGGALQAVDPGVYISGGR